MEGLMEFMMTQGASKATNLMEWDKIWAINKQKIDPIIPRYAAVGKDAVVFKLTDGPAEPTGKMEKKHPKNEELGERLILLTNEVLLDQDDAGDLGEGEQITLLHWGNCYVDKITKDAKTGKVKELVGHLNLEGSVKDTKKKIHWIPHLENQVTPCILRELDHIVTKSKIEDDDKIEDIMNPNSITDVEALADPLLKTLQKGDKMQLERRGYYIVDQAAFPPGQTMILIKIPDGKSKDVYKVDPKAAGADKRDCKKDGKKDEKQEEKPADGGKKGAESPKQKPADGDAVKAKKEAKAPRGGAKPADRPIDDISRLDIKVGKIVKCWEHPEADKLWCEEIDLGEASVRTICSGLRDHVKKEDMEGSMVVVLANLKSRKMKGFESQGMVLCATDAASGKVELMHPPAGAKCGERVTIEGVEMLDADEKLNEKTGKAPLEAVRDGMRTTASKQAAYQGKVWQTSAGPVTCKTVQEGTIS